jgi:hypothetical protein
MGPFGAADALRITAGAPDEIAFLEQALGAVSVLDAVAST